MNKQDKGNGKRGIEWCNYSWNPMGGCEHLCRWEMPDGTIAKCYAESVAEGVALPSYPQGFGEHYWHPEILNEPLALKTPAKIFLDSMSDLMKAKAPTAQVEAVLEICRQADWHTFQLLTKQAPRLLLFKDKIPTNVWIGVSMPPDYFMGAHLNRQQQERMLRRALDVLTQFPDHITWMSFEPLSWDVSVIVKEYPKALKWSVVGAASRGSKTFQPNRADVTSLLRVLDAQGCPVFFKGNLQWETWREEFPKTIIKAEPVEQLSMF
jgi:protein gp37